MQTMEQSDTMAYDTLTHLTGDQPLRVYTFWYGWMSDSIPDFFIQKRGHLLSPRYTINSPQKS